MASADPEFTVIVVAYNPGPDLATCLDALGRQDFRDFEILVVDNGSEDGSVDALSIDHSRCRLIRAGANLGFAAGNNLAAREARGGWLVLLNPDATPDPTWLSEIHAATQRYPGAAMFGSTQLKADDPDRFDGAGDHLHPLGFAWRGGAGDPAEIVDEDAEVFGPCGAAAVYRRDAFETAGGFAESFFCYYEDVDLAARLRLAGEICVQLAGARVRHAGSATAGAGSSFIRYHVARNRIWLFLRCMPGPLLTVLLIPFAAAVIARLFLAIVFCDFPARIRALYHGLGRLGAVWRERRQIQNARRIGTKAFAGMLSWSVGKLILRARDQRPISQAAYRMEGDSDDA